MSALLVATNNPGKQAEFRRLLGQPPGLPGEVVTPQELGIDFDVPEPHYTYAQNATAKAAAFCLASGVLTLADDSGIEVAALEWGPGVRSARFGGPDVADRAQYLLEQLPSGADRRARMMCWLALAVPQSQGADPRIELFSGMVDGEIAPEPRGENGFGYDPIFLLPNGLTNAQLPAVEKDRLSHRGKAIAAALPRIRHLMAAGDRAATTAR